MNKFLLKIFAFGFPILLLQVFTLLFYSPDKGDLLRIGYILDEYPDYREKFADDFRKPLKVISVDQITTEEKYDLLTIGDSFLEQGNSGFQNFLALEHLVKVVHIGKNLHKNQFRKLMELTESDFFDQFKFDYVLLEFIEAGSHGVTKSLNSTYPFSKESFSKRTANAKQDFTKRLVFPSDRIIKFPYYTVKRALYPNAGCNQVYAVNLMENPFSVPDSTLFFHASNLERINNNDREDIKQLNSKLNQLAKGLEVKGVKLIVMPVPDKLDYYFELVQDPGRLQKTEFFQIIQGMERDYKLINTLEVLKTNSGDQKDVFYFDDTHWSPVGAKIIADRIAEELFERESIRKARIQASNLE